MKRILYIIVLAVAAFLAAGCQEKIETLPEIESGIVGQWKLVKVNDEAAGDRIVYADFRFDASFTLYQKLWTVDYEKFEGSFELAGEKALKLLYDDGTVSEYPEYRFEFNGERLILVRTDGEVNTLDETVIPESVIEMAKPAPASKSGGARPML